MKAYCQFLHLSTGYVEGSIPPVFDEKNKKPIDLCGTDGVMILDARNNIENMIRDCKHRAEWLSGIKSDICGFKIFKGSRFGEGRCLCYHKF